MNISVYGYTNYDWDKSYMGTETQGFGENTEELSKLVLYIRGGSRILK